MVRPQQNPRIQDLVDRLRSALDPCTIYLFGSHATGEARPESDYDVMVVIPETDESHYKRYQHAMPALRGFGAPVDLLIYTQSEWDFLAPKRYSVARQIKDTGILLHAA